MLGAVQSYIAQLAGRLEDSSGLLWRQSTCENTHKTQLTNINRGEKQICRGLVYHAESNCCSNLSVHIISIEQLPKTLASSKSQLYTEEIYTC